MTLCKRCNAVEVAPISLGDGMSVTPPHCPRCSAEAARETRRERFEKHLAKSGMPTELWTYDRALGNGELLDWCVAHADAWIWLGGATRVGKTRALARTVVVDTWNREDWPATMWVESADFFMRLSEHGQAARAIARDLLASARTVGLLVIDDFGMEKLTDDTRAMLFSLIDYRFNRRLRTWFTSNASGDELMDHIGEGRWPQIRNRIAERGTIRTWDGSLWRETTKQYREPEQAYWWQEL